jgi:hypothetical protein
MKNTYMQICFLILSIVISSCAKTAPSRAGDPTATLNAILANKQETGDGNVRTLTQNKDFYRAGDFESFFVVLYNLAGKKVTCSFTINGKHVTTRVITVESNKQVVDFNSIYTQIIGNEDGKELVLEAEYRLSANSPVNKERAVLTKQQYQIHTVADLNGIRYDLKGKYKQMKTLKFENNFKPIPTYSNVNYVSLSNFMSNEHAFTGEYDGGNTKLVGMKIQANKESYVGMFRLLRGAKIYNVDMEGVTIENPSEIVGALAGKTESISSNSSQATALENIKVTDLRITSNITSNIDLSGFGGLVGILGDNSRISRSYVVNSAIEISSARSKGVGGIVGQSANNTFIQDSYVRGTRIKGYSQVGGIVGGVAQTQNTSQKIKLNFCLSDSCVLESTNISEGSADPIGKDANITSCYYRQITGDKNNPLSNVAAQSFETLSEILPGSEFWNHFQYDGVNIGLKPLPITYP